MSMNDPVLFIDSLLKENWNAGSSQVGYNPTFGPHEKIPGEFLPFISVTAGDDDEEPRGFTGKHYYNRDEIIITLWCYDPTQIFDGRREIRRILIENCKSPTTSEFASPGIDFLHIEEGKRADDDSESPTIFRRIQPVTVHYQDVYS